MTAKEIAFIAMLMEERFGAGHAQVSRLLLETGLMPVTAVYRRCRRMNPKIKDKVLEQILHTFFEHGLLLAQTFPDLAEDGPYISFDLHHAFLTMAEPVMCYAVEELLGDDAARVLCLVLGLGMPKAEKVFALLAQKESWTRDNAEKVIIKLLKTKVLSALDCFMKYDDDERKMEVEMVARKNYWSKLGLMVNRNRLMVAALLYMTQSKVENEPALSSYGSDVYLGLCRASLFTPLRTDYLCDDLFLPVTADDVLRNIEHNVEEMNIGIVRQNLDGIVAMVDGFLQTVDDGYAIRGPKLLGMWAESILYEQLKAEFPQVGLARVTMQFLLRHPRPYVQAKAVEMDLCSSTHALRYAVNELARCGFVDLMGTSQAASFEPGRMELFLHVNLPRLYRQKILPSQLQTLFRNHYLKSTLKKSQENVPPSECDEKHCRMELSFADSLLFSLMYIKACGAITDEKSSSEAYSLLEFFSRNTIPEAEQ